MVAEKLCFVGVSFPTSTPGFSLSAFGEGSLQQRKTTRMYTNATAVLSKLSQRTIPWNVVRSTLLRDRAWIGGEWVDAISEKTYAVSNPAYQESIGEVPDMGTTDIELACGKARHSQYSWMNRTAKERSVLLRRWHDLMVKHQTDLSNIVTLETGKPLVESKGEVAYASAYVEWFAEEGKRVYGDVVPTTSRDKRILITKRPAGVAALITPWNFPIAMLARKAAAAIAAGCSVVVKPSEETPFSALAMADLSHQAGIPPGVFNVVTCSRDSVREVGESLVNDTNVSVMSFTGSTTVGKQLMAGCAKTVKRMSLELGGNAPLIVFKTADVDKAVVGTLRAKFRNNGQACISPNRLLVHRDVHDQFVGKLAQAVDQELKLGFGFDKGDNLGPLINSNAVEKVQRHVTDAVERGGKIVTGGAIDPMLGGNFFQPTVLVNGNTSMLFNHEEIFGPLAAVIKFDTEDEAVEIANSTEYGLIAYVFSQDIRQVNRISEAMDTGIVVVNEGVPTTEVAPFGGVKQSGFGREGSKYGIEDYLDIKYVCIGDLC